MATYKDVEVRIPRAKAGGNGQASVHDVEVTVEGSGRWRGTSTLDLASLDPSDPDAYGKALGAQLANPSVMRALDQAGLTRNDCIRLRLLLDEDIDVPHWIRWERMWLPIDGVQWPPAVHPRIAFSRYIPVERPDEDPPDVPSFRLLYAIANPEDLDPDKAIKVEEEIANFLSSFENKSDDRRLQVSILPGRTSLSAELKARIAEQGWRVLGGNTTLLNLSRSLNDGYHGLHILAHGGFSPASGMGTLLLERENGRKDLVSGEQLQSWITLRLQLVVFQACQSGATPAEGQPPFTSLAPHLIRLGVPAAVAMQDRVEMEDARIFFQQFYRTLLDDGIVDVAVNRARQVLKEQVDRDNWSIPALFSRLRGGRLWRPDPLREALLAARDALPADSDDLPPFPLEVIEHTRGLATYDPAIAPSGPRFDLTKHLSELAGSVGSCTVLTGARGYSKAAQLRCLFRAAASSFLRSEPNLPLPVYLTLPELAGRIVSTWTPLSRLWTGKAGADEKSYMASRPFLFLLDGEEEMAGSDREKALQAVQQLRALPGSRVVLVADEALIPSLKGDLEDSTLLVVQSLAWPLVSVYLGNLQQEPARALQKRIEAQDLMDLVSQPRFLQHLIKLAVQGVRIDSRRQILQRVCWNYLAKASSDLVPRCCVEDAARRIAWTIQNSSGSELAGAGLYQILTAARAGREFALSDLLRELVANCRLLVPSGDEGVRFAYPALQAYFAAQYLAAAPDCKRLLDDITASLGRLARIRRWEKVLILLSSMLPQSGDLLRSILAGSPLLEGEQLFLAVRCYQEAMAERGSDAGTDPEVEQMVDALIWRSGWDAGRTYSDRRQALQLLIGLAKLYKLRQADIVPHLVALAFDPIASHWARSNREKYDWAGIRQIAATGAAWFLDDTTKYIRDKRPELLELLQAWQQFGTNCEAVCSLLARDDPRLSVIAAFALIHSECEEDRQALVSAYDRVADPDVKWGIVEALGGMESAWVQEHVVERWMKQNNGANDSETEMRNAHVCYLIQTTSFANQGAYDFLHDRLLNGTPWLQGRALRALSKLQDDDIEAWLRPLCEQIVSNGADRIDSERMKVTGSQIADATLQRSALKALSDIGDAHSLEVIRATRTRHGASDDLRELGFQVGEEIYWRLTGGLDKESYTAAALRSAEGATGYAVSRNS